MSGGTELFSAVVFVPQKIGQKPATLGSYFDLSDFGYFQSSSAAEFLLFASRECIARTALGVRQSIIYNDHYCHVAHLSGFGVAVITTGTYPQRVAHSLVNEIYTAIVARPDSGKWLAETVVDVQVPSVSEVCTQLVKKYQNPAEADKIMKIQKDLDDTKAILIQSMDKLLDRGEALNSLAAKSDDLSFQSKIFLDQSASLNSCCSIL